MKKYPSNPSNPIQIANTFLDLSSDVYFMNAMKLIKLTYLAYGYYLGGTGKTLFKEKPRLYRHGPVITSVHEEFVEFRSDHITGRGREFRRRRLCLEAYKCCEIVWKFYKKLHWSELSTLCHSEGYGWVEQGFSENDSARKPEMDDSIIKKCFEKIVTETIAVYEQESLQTKV